MEHDVLDESSFTVLKVQNSEIETLSNTKSAENCGGKFKRASEISNNNDLS